GKYLRAPAIYHVIRRKLAGRLTRLANLARVEGYIHDNNTGSEFPAVDFVKSIKDLETVLLTRDSAGVTTYGVKPSGNSTLIAPILFPRTFGSRHIVAWNRGRIHGKEFYKVIPKDPAKEIAIVAQLNSTWGILQREILGLANLGAGGLTFSRVRVGRV